MSQWQEHTVCVIPAGAYNSQWQEALDKALRTWPLWRNGTVDFNERYVGGRLRLLGYGSYGIVFRATRADLPAAQAEVAVKLFRLPTEPLIPPAEPATVDNSPDAVALRKFIEEEKKIRNIELRALVYLKAIAADCPRGCPTNLVCYVDHFRARLGKHWSPPLVNKVTPAGLTKAQKQTYMADPRRFPDLYGAPGIANMLPTELAYFIETHYESGMSLEKAIDIGFWADRVEPIVNLHLLLSAATALLFMHRANIIHHDIKPANINVANLPAAAPEMDDERYDPPEEVALPTCILLDVGLACRVENDASYPYEPGVCAKVLTSATYRAPTQVMHRHIDADAEHVELSDAERKSWDVYALGMTFYDWAWGIDDPPSLSIDDAQKAIVGTFNADAYPAPGVDQSAENLSVLKNSEQRSRLPTKPYWPAAPNDDEHGFFNNLLAHMLDFKDSRRFTIEQVVAELDNFASSRSSSPRASSTRSTPPSSPGGSFRSVSSTRTATSVTP
jgi:serine/threonine protein kinase